MRKYILTVLIAIAGNIVYAQQLLYEDYDWELTPNLHTLSESEAKEPQLLLKDKTAIEYAYDSKGTLQSYLLTHKIIKVNTNEAIEDNNKIYLPYSDESEIIRQKVRVITSTGKILKLGYADIKEAKDEETESVYRYFALEGVDLGSEIEYYFYMHTTPNYMGAQKTLQSEVPRKNVEFELIAPPNLMFTAKSYNGLQEMIADTSDADHNILNLQVAEIPALKAEDFSNYDANLKMVVYKLDKNVYAKKTGIVNYGDAAEAIYASIYNEVSKGSSKKIDKLLEEIAIPKNADEEKKIRTIEQYIKTKFVLLSYHPDYQEIEVILEKKAADEKGVTKLFANIFSKLNIEHQLVLTTNRFDIKFDPDFEAYNFLETYLIYFPKINMYMAPAAQLSRLEFVPPAYMNNYGMFIKPVEVGDYKSGVGKVRFIDAISYDKSNDNMYIEAKFNNDFAEPVYSLRREQTGYYAASSQPYYDYFDIEQKKKTTDELVKFMSEEATIIKVAVENEGTENYPVKPFIINATFKASKFIEKAGSKYLFKVGELIGPQAEMYQESQRVTEAENGFNRRYHRVIKFTIPEGYSCNNLDAINFNVTQDIDGERTTQFISTYKITGNEIQIEIEEFYNRIIFSLDQFEDFRKVVNAAADFNKVVLIFEKK